MEKEEIQLKGKCFNQNQVFNKEVYKIVNYKKHCITMMMCLFKKSHKFQPIWVFRVKDKA